MTVVLDNSKIELQLWRTLKRDSLYFWWRISIKSIKTERILNILYCTNFSKAFCRRFNKLNNNFFVKFSFIKNMSYQRELLWTFQNPYIFQTKSSQSLLKFFTPFSSLSNFHVTTQRHCCKFKLSTFETLTLFTRKTKTLLYGVWKLRPRRKNKRFYHKLLIKDNDDDLFHYAERMKNNLGFI